MHLTIDIDLRKFETGFSKLQQLEALLASTSGAGFEPFISLDPSLQDHIIMLAADLAQEARINLAILG
jgi:hypothetical protein